MNSKTQYCGLVAAGLVMLTARPAMAQVIAIDWEHRKLTACPAEVDATRAGKYRIDNINNIAYDYDVNFTATEVPPKNPLMDIFGAAANKAADASTPKEVQCQHDFDALRSILFGQVLPEDKPPYKSLKLSDSLAAWAKLEAAMKAFEDGSCADVIGKPYADFKTTVDTIRPRIGKPHFVEYPMEFRPGYSYEITVRELYKGALTTDGEKPFTCAPVSHALTLSFGMLLTRIEERSYAARKAPGQTENILAVDGRAYFRPTFAALFNYELPLPRRLSNPDFGVALTAGPTIKLTGGKADTSNFGFFVGPTLHLRRLLYISPGFHIGQFADFPIGFYDGRTVPANFGELTPTKRWTTRFGLGISFRTPDFSRILGSSGDKKSTPAATTKPAANQ